MPFHERGESGGDLSGVFIERADEVGALAAEVDGDAQAVSEVRTPGRRGEHDATLVDLVVADGDAEAPSAATALELE